jgi:hypothetical protein
MKNSTRQIRLRRKKQKHIKDADPVTDFEHKVIILECTTCGYQLRIKNHNQFLKYRSLHEQQSGHTGTLLYEDRK